MMKEKIHKLRFPKSKYGHWDLFGDTIEHSYAHWGLTYSDGVCFPINFSVINWHINDNDGGYWEIVASVHEIFNVDGQEVKFAHRWESQVDSGITFNNRDDAMKAVDDILTQIESKGLDDW